LIRSTKSSLDQSGNSSVNVFNLNLKSSFNCDDSEPEAEDDVALNLLDWFLKPPLDFLCCDACLVLCVVVVTGSDIASVFMCGFVARELLSYALSVSYRYGLLHNGGKVRTESDC
jgi:hypothetical protein